MVLAELPIGAALLLAQADMSRREHFLATCKSLDIRYLPPPSAQTNRPNPNRALHTNAVAAAAAAAAANQSTHPPIALSREPTLAAQSTHAPHAARSGDLVRPAEL